MSGNAGSSPALDTLLAALLLVCAVSLAEEPDFMRQVMPVVCSATKNFTRRIWYLACVEYLMEYGIEKDANYCFDRIDIQNWEEAFLFFCQHTEASIHLSNFLSMLHKIQIKTDPL